MKYFKLSEIKSVRLNEIPELIKSKWAIFKIPHVFDIAELNSSLKITASTFQFVNKDNYDTYKGICLQSQLENDPSVYTDLDAKYYTLHKKTVSENQVQKNISHFNNAGELYKKTFADLSSQIKLDRGRILLAEPGCLLKQHEDGPRHMTLHIPLFTNSLAHMVINGEEYHLAADGSIYIANTALPHFIYNAGSSDRIHITFRMSPDSFIKN